MEWNGGVIHFECQHVNEYSLTFVGFERSELLHDVCDCCESKTEDG